MGEIQTYNAHSFLNQFVQGVNRGTRGACGCVCERRESVDTLWGCQFKCLQYANFSADSISSYIPMVQVYIPSILTPPLLNIGAYYLAPSPVHLWYRLSSFLLTKGADDASISYHIGMASRARVKQTEMFQVCVGQLGIHLRHLRVCQECFSRV